MQQQVRAAVRGACPSVRSVEHLTVHYLQFHAAVEVAIHVDDALTVREARLIAEGARNAIVSAVPDVAMADIHLDLLESSPQSMYDEYNSANELTASKGVELELRGPLRANDPGETLAS